MAEITAAAAVDGAGASGAERVEGLRADAGLHAFVSGERAEPFVAVQLLAWTDLWMALCLITTLDLLSAPAVASVNG